MEAIKGQDELKSKLIELEAMLFNNWPVNRFAKAHGGVFGHGFVISGSDRITFANCTVRNSPVNVANENT